MSYWWYGCFLVCLWFKINKYIYNYITKERDKKYTILELIKYETYS